jgi:hypothetical protein
MFRVVATAVLLGLTGCSGPEDYGATLEGPVAVAWATCSAEIYPSSTAKMTFSVPSVRRSDAYIEFAFDYTQASKVGGPVSCKTNPDGSEITELVWPANSQRNRTSTE